MPLERKGSSRCSELKNYLALDCELEPIDLGRGNQGTPEYAALNFNRMVPTLEDDGIVL
jgi:glutathione S-transferase